MRLPATRVPVSRDQAAVAGLFGLALGYGLAVRPVVHSPEQLVYPLLWLAASALALRYLVAPRLGSTAPRSLALGLTYALVLLWVAGLVGPASGRPGLDISLGIPGWGPAVFYTGHGVSVSLVPFLTVGYLTLGLLVAVALERSWTAPGSGLLGLFACVGCTAPVLAGLAGSIGAGSLAAALSSAQYPIATVAFVLALAGLGVSVSRPKR
jgi:hypothetical protein